MGQNNTAHTSVKQRKRQKEASLTALSSARGFVSETAATTLGPLPEHTEPSESHIPPAWRLRPAAQSTRLHVPWEVRLRDIKTERVTHSPPNSA